ncbi:peptidylprolyl isomerase [Cohnella faecalis]|uniref:peptidylprolyl isomerase n=1 Tax=Cohnella faecalis TaxID=2315694 RepID=A0A398CQX6_9BACL|nr:peptidylprolyl isomerase [Cohnella faecalis]RIE01334.1 hypothetical protein D3H35_23455 [Cohnella faecalis]
MGETMRPIWPLVMAALLLTLLGLSGCTSELSPSPTQPSETPPPDASGKPVGAADPDVAVVGGRSIPRSELMERLLTAYGSQTVRAMMLRLAIRLESEALGLELKDDELERELRGMSEGYESEEQYYAAMKEQLGMNRDEVRKDARDRLLLEKIATKDISVTEQEIAGYRKAHEQEFEPRKQFQLAKIVLDDSRTAESVLDQLSGGADFAAMAARYSTDDLTASNGGELGWVDENDPFEDGAVLEEAKGMSIGETTGPIEVESGYAIIRLSGTNTIQKADESDIKEQIRRTLALEKAAPLSELEQSLLDKYEARVLDPALQP